MRIFYFERISKRSSYKAQNSGEFLHRSASFAAYFLRVDYKFPPHFPQINCVTFVFGQCTK